MTTPRPVSIGTILRKQRLGLRKSLGQNFLKDEHTAWRIVELSGVKAGDRVVEIGPGLGSLTQPLLEKAGHIVAIEQDQRMIPPLKERLEGIGTLEVIHGSGVTMDYTELANRLGGPIHIVANLPYQVSSPILLQLLAHWRSIKTMTLMFQREVADRLVAKPATKAYGSLSVQCQTWTVPKKVLTVPPGAFLPPPKVHSAVVHFTMLQEPAVDIDDIESYREVIRAAFNQRRKTLRNSMKRVHEASENWLARADIDSKRRGETLSLEEFARLAKTRPDTESEHLGKKSKTD
ncbi:MAG: ribosomal RNA small subunit methyltransferase A [Magnetococcales bacterium]|nr:ribosomal RNA small subunit methyltransferase A [Magnetococcales bacterium]